MGGEAGSKEKRGYDLRHYCNSRHYSTSFNYPGSLPEIESVMTTGRSLRGPPTSDCRGCRFLAVNREVPMSSKWCNLSGEYADRLHASDFGLMSLLARRSQVLSGPARRRRLGNQRSDGQGMRIGEVEETDRPATPD